MALKTYPFDASEFLDCPATQFEYLRLAYEGGDPQEIDESLKAVMRARDLVAGKNSVGKFV